MMASMPPLTTKHRLQHRLLACYITLAVLLAPVIALAREDEETQRLEGRLEGYVTQVRLQNNGTSLTWMFIGFLSVLCLATLFKNAKRTHLD
jgi:hypothetical protein